MRGILKYFLTLCILIWTNTWTHAAAPPIYQVEQTTRSIKIDGVVEPAEWADALTVNLTFEVEPGENISAPVGTTAYVTYDKHNLYVAFVALDPEPDAIRAQITDRDRAWADDFVGIAIDPFNDSRRGYEFFVNPRGVQMDMKRVEGNGEDSSWDTIWSCAGTITETGYMTEMAIPFRSISFPNGSRIHTWGFWFFRAYPRAFRHQLSNVPFDRDKNCFFCQLSRLEGFHGVHPGKNLEINPTLVARETRFRQTTGGPMIDDGRTSQLGLNVRWTPATNITLNAALNPDFSQVEADTAKMSFNRQFSLFYEEKRPFFLEGADIFETNQRYVHTRTVADPSYSVKASGKSGKYAWGIFTARDTITNILLPGNTGSDYVSWDHESDVYVARARRDVGNNSTMGALITHRTGGGYHNTLASVDGRLYFSEQDTLEFQFTATDTRNPLDPENDNLDGSDREGTSYHVHYEHENRYWGLDAWHSRVEPEFRADVGFIPMVDYEETGLSLMRMFYGKDGAFISRVFPEFTAEIQKSTDGTTLHRVFHFENNLRMAGQTYLGVFFDEEMRHHQGINHHYANYGFWAGGRTRFLGYHTEFFTGENLDFANNRIGNWQVVSVDLTWRLGPRIELQTDLRRETMNVKGQELYAADILQGKFIYNFSTRMFVRAILQYTSLEQNPALYEDLSESKTRSLMPQLLFSYKINPRTLLHFGYSGRREFAGTTPMQTMDRTLFFKIAYAWHL